MKKYSSLCVVLIVLLICASVPISALEIQTPPRLPLTEQADRLAVRHELLAMRKQVLEQHLVLMELLMAGNEMRAALMEKLEASRGSLPRETAEELKETRRQIRVLFETLKETKGDIRELFMKLRNLKPHEEFAAMKAIYADILAVIDDRIATAQLINELLENMLELDFGS